MPNDWTPELFNAVSDVIDEARVESGSIDTYPDDRYIVIGCRICGTWDESPGSHTATCPIPALIAWRGPEGLRARQRGGPR